MKKLTEAFHTHVQKLETIGTTSKSKDRREDAVRSLATICLLVNGWKPEYK